MKRTLENNVNIQTKQIVKQFDNKEKFSQNTQGSWQKRNAEFIRYQEEINDVIVNVTVKIEEAGVKIIRNGEIKMILHFVEGEDTDYFI